MAPVLHLGADVVCVHGGRLAPLTASGRVRVGGQLALTSGQACDVHGCPHRGAGGAPSPCSVACWPAGAARVRSCGRAVLVEGAPGTCTPNGTGVVVRRVQTRVRAR